jgi:hypothetical protein
LFFFAEQSKIGRTGTAKESAKPAPGQNSRAPLPAPSSPFVIRFLRTNPKRTIPQKMVYGAGVAFITVTVGAAAPTSSRAQISSLSAALQRGLT